MDNIALIRYSVRAAGVSAGRSAVPTVSSTMSILKNVAGWIRGRHGPAAEAAAAPPVAVIAGVPLEDDSPLVRATAERLRQREAEAGGWAAEAGGLPLEAYLPEARRLVQRVALGGGEASPD